MDSKMQKFITLLIALQLFNTIECERTQDKMYSAILGASCFRRMNGTHSTGCSSSFGGSVGVLHVIQSISDFDFVINNPPAPPYALVIRPALFTRENIINVVAKAKNNIAGIILINNSTKLQSFSQESKCPNQYGALLEDQKCDINKADGAWNPYGTGLLHENFPFPIYFVKDETVVHQILECYRKFNSFDTANQHKRTLCSIQINAFMSAAVNSEVCIRRTKYLNNVNPTRYCDPLQGKNLFATLFPRPLVTLDDPKSTITASSEQFIVVAARLDTTSMFDGVGLGALDSLVPFVSLISIAHTLSKLIPTDKPEMQSNILFIIFNGESYDYIGSQRLIYDMEKGLFPPPVTSTRPIALKDIKLFIDIGSLDDTSSISVYRYKDFPLAQQLATLLQNYNQKNELNVNTISLVTPNLPPTSAQSFLRDNVTFPATILYSNSNKNRFYHSIYDNEHNINFKYYNTSEDFTKLQQLNATTVYPLDSIQIALRNVSSALAYSIYELVSNTPITDNLGANPHLIDELLYCFLHSADCPLFKAASKPDSFIAHNVPPPRYISVQGSATYETIGWTFRILGLLLGNKVAEDEKNCMVLPLSWFAGFDGTGECRRTTQNLSDAYSPAFTIENYNWTSGRYSTWTESTWREINARLFLKPSVSHEALTLAIGIVTMIISFVFVFLLNSRSDVLFGDSTSSVGALTAPSHC